MQSFACIRVNEQTDYTDTMLKYIWTDIAGKSKGRERERERSKLVNS